MRQLVVLCSLLFLCACDNSRVFEGYKDFTNRKWSAREVVTFDFEIQNANLPYNLYYRVRNTLSYPYYNLYITYEIVDSQGKVLVAKMIDNNLMHPQTGEPLGSGSGDLFDNQFVLLSNHQFLAAGKYQVRLHQYMRVEELPEILAVGMRVEKVEK